ncbi:MAG: hypothetical protein FWE57_07265 [Chitinispirillia bacterium]|nr:hypothetical protein [Chitinispirillia bacterium]
MIIQKIDNIEFKINELRDFSFLNKYGKVFCVFDENDSGNISFGVDNGEEKHFVKIAGAKTLNSCISQEKTVDLLKSAMPTYRELKHPNLIELIDDYAVDDLYVAVFKWADGECLFDHWNFDKYMNNPSIVPPIKRFKRLSCEKRLNAFNTYFDFLAFTESKNHVAVDFYDGSIMYDFKRDFVTICDIDFFRKSPAVNDMGKDFWGAIRLKAPEEYILGARIDSVTNVFTLGAMLFGLFGVYDGNDLAKMYAENAFFPCKYEFWELNEDLYKIALKAVSKDRKDRYRSVKNFHEEWAGRKVNYLWEIINM